MGAKSNKVKFTLQGQNDSPSILIKNIDLERLLDILISNAIYHAEEKSSIEIIPSKHPHKLLSINNRVRKSESASNFQPSIFGLGHEIVNTLCKDINLMLHFHIDESQAYTRLCYTGEER